MADIGRELRRLPGRGRCGRFIPARLVGSSKDQRHDQQQKEQKYEGGIASHAMIFPKFFTISSSVGSGTLTIKGRNKNGRCSSRLVV